MLSLVCLLLFAILYPLRYWRHHRKQYFILFLLEISIGILQKSSANKEICMWWRMSNKILYWQLILQRRKEYLSSLTRHLSSKPITTCKVFLALLALLQINSLMTNLKSFLSKVSSIYFKKHLPMANGWHIEGKPGNRIWTGMENFFNQMRLVLLNFHWLKCFDISCQSYIWLN